MTGTIINFVCVVAAGIVGSLLGNRLPDRMRQTVIAGIGLVVLLIGFQMALQTKHVLIVLGSIAIGGILGEIVDLDLGLQRLGKWLESRVGSLSRNAPTPDEPAATRPDFARAFVTSSLVFCVGPMSILGAIQDGLTGDYQTLAVKSMLDGFAGLAFASTLGIGVAFSGLTVLIYQGAISLGAGLVKDVLTEPMIVEMTATGGLLIVGIGLQLLEIRRIRVANLLPAVALAPIAVALFGAWL